MSHYPSTDSLFTAWDLYQSVIQHNYMRHAEIIANLKTRAHDGLSILDLGCGDAYTVREAFSGCEGIDYCGVDLSAAAIDCAPQALSLTGWDIHLVTDDISKVLTTLQIRFDYIIAGYSLHHLSDDIKQGVLTDIHRLLKPGGCCIIYDLLPEDGEAPECFIDRFLQDCDASWGQFNAEQLAAIRTHVEGEDKPVTLQQWRRMAREVGFERIDLSYRDPKQHYGILELS